jgi:serine/threonine protein kinase
MEKYNRQKLIGTGAFGQAWLIQSKADGQQLVMKEIKIATVSFTDSKNRSFYFILTDG